MKVDFNLEHQVALPRYKGHKIDVIAKTRRFLNDCGRPAVRAKLGISHPALRHSKLDPAKIVEWVTEAYSETNKIMQKVNVRS